MTPQALRWVIFLTGLGLAAAAVILLLPPRSEALALYCLTTLGFVFATIRAGIAAVVSYQAQRRYLSATLALLTVILLLSVCATLNDLRLLLHAAP